MIRILDRLALAGMGLGFCLLFWPWGAAHAFRGGFFLLLIATVVQIVTSHLVKPEADEP